MSINAADVIVLVVEDDRDTRMAVSDLLGLEGYAVIESGSAEAGMKLLRVIRRRVVVVFDNIMPGKGGAGLLAAVLADNTLATRHAYVLMTASPQRAEADLHDALVQLGVPIIAKPFAAEALLELVAQAAQKLTGSVQQKRRGRSQ